MDLLSFALQIVAIGFTRLVARNYPQSFDEKKLRTNSISECMVRPLTLMI